VTTRRLLVAGVVGSTLVAVGGWGSGALPPGTSGRGPGTPLVLVGVLLLSAAWWRLRERAGRAALLWSVPLLLAPPMFSRDVYAYAGQAALVVEGLDPYAVGPAERPGPLVDGVDDVWRDTPSPYGPLWLALAGLVVRATGDRLGRRWSACAAWPCSAWCSPAGRCCGSAASARCGSARQPAGPAAPARRRAQRGAHARPRPRRPRGLPGRLPGRVAAAAVLVTLGALVKLPVVAVLPFVVMAVPGGWPARARAAAVAAVAAAVTAALVTLVSGLGWGWLGTLDAGRARLSLFSVTTGLGLLLPGGAAALDAALVAGVLVGAGTAAVLLWRTPRLGAPLAAGLALLAVGLLLPVVQPWYVLWGVLPLAAAAGPRLAAAVGALCLVLCLLVWPSGRSVVRPPLHGPPDPARRRCRVAGVAGRPRPVGAGRPRRARGAQRTRRTRRRP
jgi:hypothetical protein